MQSVSYRFWCCATLLVVAITGCERKMIPPPYIMRGEPGLQEFAKVQPALQSGDISVMYVTDRGCDEIGTCGPVYGHKRNRAVEYGIATVGLTPEPTWDELVAACTNNTETQPYALYLKSVENLGGFQEPASRYSIESGQLTITPQTIAELQKEREAFHKALSKWLDHTDRKDAYVYVHGFNNTFEDAVFRMAECWNYAARKGVPIVFTWPAGYGGLFGYAYDRESGEFAVMHLKMLLLALADCPQIERVHIVSHSRGTDVATTAVRELHMEIRAAGGRGMVGLLGDRRVNPMTPEEAAKMPTTAEFLKLHTLILAAPDLDADVFSQRFMGENLPRASDRVAIYFSQGDSALGWAEWLFNSGTGRVGDLSIDDFTPEQVAKLSQLPSIELISCETKGYSSHSYMFMHPAALSDLLLLLREDKPAGASNGRPLEQPRPGLWLLPNDYLKPAK